MTARRGEAGRLGRASQVDGQRERGLRPRGDARAAANTAQAACGGQGEAASGGHCRGRCWAPQRQGWAERRLMQKSGKQRDPRRRANVVTVTQQRWRSRFRGLQQPRDVPGSPAGVQIGHLMSFAASTFVCSRQSGPSARRRLRTAAKWIRAQLLLSPHHTQSWPGPVTGRRATMAWAPGPTAVIRGHQNRVNIITPPGEGPAPSDDGTPPHTPLALKQRAHRRALPASVPAAGWPTARAPRAARTARPPP